MNMFIFVYWQILNGNYYTGSEEPAVLSESL